MANCCQKVRGNKKKTPKTKTTTKNKQKNKQKTTTTKKGGGGRGVKKQITMQYFRSAKQWQGSCLFWGRFFNVHAHAYGAISHRADPNTIYKVYSEN